MPVVDARVFPCELHGSIDPVNNHEARKKGRTEKGETFLKWLCVLFRGKMCCGQLQCADETFDTSLG